MDQKPKARSAKKKEVPKKKAPDEKQFERFIETAQTLGVHEDKKSFEKVFDLVVRGRSKPK